MKKLQKSILILMVAVMVFAAGLLAACTKTVKLTFMSDGEVFAEEKAVVGETFKPTVPEKEGFFFEGWYVTEDGSGSGYTDSITVPEKNTTYYAKWEQGYTLTLDTDGGTLATTTILMRKGANVYEAVKTLVPEKSGLTFGAWFDGNEELSELRTMPAETLTLKAKYKVGYTVNVYTQDLNDRAHYTLDNSLKVTGTDYVAATVAAPAVEGFVKVAHADESKSLVLTQTASGNVFNLYYDRQSYRIIYDANAPEGAAVGGSTEETPFVYGEDAFAAESGFVTNDPYRFAGWATTANGEVAYKAGDKLPFRSGMLFAVWDRGYTNRFGGGDFVYLPKLEAGVAILDRLGIEYRGSVDSDGVFTIETPAGKLMGKTGYNHTFAYAGQMKAGTYYFYDSYYKKGGEDHVDKTTMLVLDDYMGGVYTYTDKEGNAKSEKGVVIYDSALGDYIFMITEGANEGAYFFFIYGTANDNETPVFAVQGDEFGGYNQFVPYDSLLSGTLGDYQLVLDGYGSLAFYDTYYREYYDGYYSIDYENSSSSVYKILVHAYNSDGYLLGRWKYDNGWVDFTIYLIMFEDEGVYLFFEENLSVLGEFRGKKGEKLVLDGFGGFADSAVYTDADGAHKGSFFAHESELFGIIVEFTDNESKAMKTFRILADGTFEEMSGNFTEYWQLTTDDEDFGRYTFAAPVVVLYDEEVEGGLRADVYAEVSYVLTKVATGFYTFEKKGNFYIYTFTRTSVEEDFDGELFTKIVFLVDVLNTRNQELIAGYYVFEEDGEPVYDLFTGEDGESIWFADFGGYVGRGAFYQTAGGVVYEGSFSYAMSEYFEDKCYGMFRAMLENSVESYYFEVDLENKSFKPVEFLPYGVYRGTVTYNYMQEDFIIGPNGEACFLVLDSWEYVEAVVKGTYTEKEVNEFGVPVYSFTPEANDYGITAFDFVLEMHVYDRYGSTIPVYFRYSASEHKTLTSGEEKLVLDGFCFCGTYYAADGEVYTGLCYYENSWREVLVFWADSGEMFYFDLTEDGFTVRDDAYGYYSVLNDNSQNVNHWAFEFGGYGELLVFDNWDYRYVGKGVYELLNAYTHEYLVTIELYSGGEPLTFTVMLISTSSTSACVIHNNDIAALYFADDLSMLYLDGYNYSTYYIDAFGVGHLGAYFVLEEGVGSYTQDDGTTFIFTYDLANKSFKRIESDERIVGAWYASDFHSTLIIDSTVVLDGGQKEGYFYTKGDTAIFYFLDWSFNITKQEAKLENGALIYNGTTYYRVTGEITLTGTIYVDGEARKTDVVIRFMPSLEDGRNKVEVFFIDEAHTGVTIYFYFSYWDGSIVPCLCRDGWEYENIQMSWNADGTGSFELRLTEGQYGTLVGD